MDVCLHCEKEVEYVKSPDGVYCPLCGWELKAAEAFAKKNPRGSRQRKELDRSIFNITYFTGGFVYNNIKYNYEDIYYLSYIAAEKLRKISFIPFGYRLMLRLDILFKNNHPLVIKRNITYATKKVGAEFPEERYLFAAWKRILRESVPFRIQRYEKEFRRNGYIEWCKAKWFYNEFEYKNNRCPYINCIFIVTDSFIAIKQKIPNPSIFRGKPVFLKIREEQEMVMGLLKNLFKVEIAKPVGES
jgi:hypothetical protein